MIEDAGAKPETTRTTRRRAAAAALVAGPVIFLLAEFIAAAAWTDPPYSYTYHYISDLGVRGPLEVLGQYMHSPLDWVMNTGFFAFGLLVPAGVTALDGLRGRHRWAVLVTGTLVGAGAVVLAFFPGDGEADRQGTVDFHGLGALATIVGGNILIILLGRLHRPLGMARRPGRVLVVLGVFGIVSLAVFLAVASANVLVGLVERCAVYPVLVGLIRAGASMWTRPGPEPAETVDTHLRAGVV